MNFLFALAQGLFSALVLLALYWVVPNKVWRLIPPEYLQHRRTAALSVAAVVVIAVTWNAAGTYGPRISLDRAALPAGPDSVKIEGGAEMVTNKGGVGKRFDDEIKAGKP